MAQKYIDNRLTTGANDGSSPANAWRSLYDARIGTMAAGDTINFVAGSGPYYEAVNQSAGLNVRASDISFDAATRRIRSTASTFASFTAGHIIRVMGSQSNDGQYTVSSVSGAGPFDLIVAASNALTDETAGNTIRVVNIQPATNTTVPMVLDPGHNGSSPSPITWVGNGCEVSAGWDLCNSIHTWTRSTTNPQEWYVRRTGGTNPSLLNPQSGTVNGNFICASAGDATHNRGTVGSLSFDGQYGYGDNDSLGYSTVYVRAPGNPKTLGWTVVVSQVEYCYYQNWTDHIFQGVIFSYGNGMANGDTSGACIFGRGTRLKFQRCAFLYADGHGAEASATGPFTFDHCIFYWTGHRSIYLSGNVTCSMYNCVGYASHLFALIAAGVGATGVLNLYGNICANNEAGAIDKKSASAVLNEDYNCWYPQMTAAGGALGYVSTANWALTAVNDIPAQTATTVSSQAALTNPNFTTLSDTALASCNFRLTDQSQCAGRGPWELGDSFTDYAGNTYTGGAVGIARALNMGCYETAVMARPIIEAARVLGV